MDRRIAVYAVSTRLRDGKGGISSALAGLNASVPFRRAGVRYIESHVSGREVSSLVSAMREVMKESRAGTVFWFHCGPSVSMARKLVLALVARARGARIVFHFHSPTLHRFLLTRRGRAFLRVFFRVADGIVLLTPWWERQVLGQFPALRCPILVSPNALAPEWIDLARQPLTVRPEQSDRVRIVALGRLVPEKGFGELVGAMEALPERYHLVIGGDGPMRAELERRVTSSGLRDRVEFLGWVPYDDKMALLLECDIFCLPSRYDSFGMSYIEAMAAGLPVVALHQGAVPDVVPDQEAGILLRDGEPHSIAAAILECEHRTAELGQRGKEEVVRRFDSRPIAEDLLDYFESLG